MSTRHIHCCDFNWTFISLLWWSSKCPMHRYSKLKKKKKGQNMTSIKTHFHDCEATIKALTTARNVLSSVWTP